MTRNTSYHSVFYHHTSSGQCVYPMVYVDDIVITDSDRNDIRNLKQNFFNHFQTKELGKLKYFLRIEIAQSKSLWLCLRGSMSWIYWRKLEC